MAGAAKTRLPVVFGAMTIGKRGVEQTRVHDLKDAAALLDVFQKHGHNRIDTARVYGQGSSEEYLGQLGWQDRGIIMDTKLYPSGSMSLPGAEPITHTPEGLRTHLFKSLDALKTKKLDMWYLHGPDRKVPYEVTFKAVNDLYKEGYFERLGISNYMSWEVAQISEICIKNGWIRPTVYQGVYNAIHRAVEPELFTCLKYYGISFFAFNPLAGGFLTSRYSRKTLESDIESSSRFDPKTSQGKSYRTRYWNDTMFSVLESIREVGKKHGFTEAEIALRWIMHHSKLTPEAGDAVIIGASSTKHLEENLEDMEKGPLPQDVLDVLDTAWAKTKAVVTPYYH